MPNNSNLKTDDFLQKLKKVVRIVFYYMTNSYRPGLKKFDWFKGSL